MDIKSLENLCKVTMDRGNLCNRQSDDTQKDHGRPWSSQEWKCGTA